jgi:CBS domain-containing protein
MNKISKLQYSKEAIGAFVLLVLAYLVILVVLWLIEDSGVVHFTTDINGDVLKLITALPFVALYILVFIGATAGYARSAIVAKELPFNKYLNQELKKKKISSATIMTKIRSGASIKKDTPYPQVVDRLISARLPILAVVGEKNKVEGVITYYDIVKQLQSEMEQHPEAQISALSQIHVENIKKEVSSIPVMVAESENLKDVLDTMVKHRYNRLIVVKDKDDNVYSGVVDIFDVISELLGSEEDSGE